MEAVDRVRRSPSDLPTNRPSRLACGLMEGVRAWRCVDCFDGPVRIEEHEIDRRYSPLKPNTIDGARPASSPLEIPMALKPPTMHDLIAMGTVHGATPAPDRFGNAGRAFHFDGVDDYIVIDPPPTLNPDAMSVSAWVRYDALRHTAGWSDCIVAQDDGNDGDQSRRVFQLSTWQGGRIVWHRMMGARDPMCRLPFSVGAWVHVAAVYEHGEHRIYANGELHDSVRHSFWTHPSQPIHIGRKGTDESVFFFHGDIGDVRLYDHALTDADVRALVEGLDSPRSA